MIAVGKNDPLMNAAGQWNSQEAIGFFGHQRDRLTGVAEDERGFVVVLGGLVQLFDRRHFASALTDLESIGKQNHATVGRKQERSKRQDQDTDPPAGEFIKVNGLAVEEVKHPVITILLQAQCANQAGYPSEI